MIYTSQKALTLEGFKLAAVRATIYGEYFFADGSFVEVTKYDVYRYLPNGFRTERKEQS